MTILVILILNFEVKHSGVNLSNIAVFTITHFIQQLLCSNYFRILTINYYITGDLYHRYLKGRAIRQDARVNAEARRSDRRGVDNHLLGNTEGHRRHIDDGLPDSPIGHTTHTLWRRRRKRDSSPRTHVLLTYRPSHEVMHYEKTNPYEQRDQQERDTHYYGFSWAAIGWLGMPVNDHQTILVAK